MSLLTVIVVIAVTSAVPAYVIARSPWLSVGVAPLIFVILATIAGMIATLGRVSVLWPFVGIVVASNAISVLALRGARLPTRRDAQLLAGAVITGVAAYCLVPLKAPYIAGDTRTHWFGPARWFFGGGAYVWDAIGNPAFAHRDYPPLMPGSVGMLWRLQGHIDLRSGQMLVSLANFGAIVLVGLAIPRFFPRFGIMPTVAGSMLVLAGYGFAGEYGNDGFADLLWSAAATAAVLYLLLAPVDTVDTWVGTTALVVAGLTKNEGTVVALAIVAFACWRRRQRLREAYMLFGALPIILLWPVHVRLRGVQGDLQMRDVLAFLRGESRIWRRLGPTIRATVHQTLVIVIVAAVCTALGVTFARGVRRRLQIGSTGWTWATATVATTAISSAYVIASDSLSAHLSSSIGRTTIYVRLLLLTETAIWALVALKIIARHPPPTTEPAIEPETTAQGGYGTEPEQQQPRESPART